tara:strand:+ start:2063 stop:4225 length:2163 start_codon:yes stop_codon:yes gene_type:complete
MTARTRIAKIFGIKLLPVSGKVLDNAEKMLDTERQYLDFLRNKKKFFFMTQIQQTRVVVGKKKSTLKQQEKKKKRQTTGTASRLRTLRRLKKGLGKRWGSKGKKLGKVGKVLRNTRAGALKLGRKIKRSPVGRLVKGLKGAGTKVGGKLKGLKAGALKAVKGPAMKIASKVKNIAKAGKAKATKVAGQGVKLAKNLGGKALRTKLGKELTEKGVKLAAKTGLKKVGAKAAVKLGGKAAVKVGLKKIPGIGLIAGLGFGLQRLMKGDIGGALMEAGSGIASTVPGVGTAISVGIDAALIAKDLNEPPAEEALAEGGQVSSPTQALIGEGGEPELVVPQSKLGPVFQNMLKKTGSILTSVTTGFLTTLPTPGPASQAVLGEVAKVNAIFGEKPEPIGIFKGSKLASLVGGFAKKAAGMLGGAAKAAFGMTPMGMIAGAVGSMFKGAPAAAAEVPSLESTTTESSKESSTTTMTMAGETSSTSVSGFPITDFYGPSDWRPKPHGGVDVGTPVGTAVGFNTPGEILYSGRAGGYGNLMDVWLPAAKIQMRIAHLSKFIKKSGEFYAGEVLAETGGAKGDPGAGSSTGPHLHFEADTKKNSTRYGGSGNPLPFASMLQLGTPAKPEEESKGEGGPSLETGFSPSYGHPISSTVKWPSSNGAMGGPSLTPNEGSVVTTGKQVSMIPIPMPIAQQIPVPVTMFVPMGKKDGMKAYGIDSFSGKYGEL